MNRRRITRRINEINAWLNEQRISHPVNLHTRYAERLRRELNRLYLIRDTTPRKPSGRDVAAGEGCYE